MIAILMAITLVIVIKKPLVILDLWVVVMDLNSAKHVKVLSVALHPAKVWDWCMSEDEKRK